MKCECGERLRLIVKDEQETVYTINADGSLEHEDSRGGGQDFRLECNECDNTYDFTDEDYFEMQEMPQLYRLSFINKTHSSELIKQNINELKIAKRR